GYPTTTTAGEAHALQVVLLDAFGNVAAGFTGTVTFRSDDLQAGLPADYTFTAADAGVHTFLADLKTAGARLLVAASDNLTGAQQVLVQPAGAAFLELITQVQNVDAGTELHVQVAAFDAFGNDATGYNDALQLTFTDPLASTTTPAVVSGGAGDFA